MGRDSVVGYGSVLIPTQAGRHNRVAHLYAPQPSSMLQRFRAWVSGAHPEVLVVVTTVTQECVQQGFLVATMQCCTSRRVRKTEWPPAHIVAVACHTTPNTFSVGRLLGRGWCAFHCKTDVNARAPHERNGSKTGRSSRSSPLCSCSSRTLLPSFKNKMPTVAFPLLFTRVVPLPHSFSTPSL